MFGKTKVLVACVLLGQVSAAEASWVSEITGVDVDLNRGTVSIKPPNLGAIPQALQNLPKDASQALLNPAAPALASARSSRASTRARARPADSAADRRADRALRSRAPRSGS